jgi:hypothetical protein
MKFDDTFFSSEDRYSVGVESISGRYYASIPVSNGIVDYEEYYDLTRDQHDEFLHNSAAAIALVGGGNTMACSSNDRAVTVVLRYKSGSVPCQH